MIVRETKNAGEVKSVLCHPQIYDCIASDNCPPAKDFEPPISDDYKYIVGLVEGEIIGVVVYHSYMDGNECHIQVLPKFRKEYAKKFGAQAFEFRGVKPLYAKIPDLYKNVLEFARSFNFEVIDKELTGYVKNGVAYPMNILRYKDGIC